MSERSQKPELSEKEAKLAQALRANLRRRKAPRPPPPSKGADE